MWNTLYKNNETFCVFCKKDTANKPKILILEKQNRIN